jgi:ferredoxin-type protein NapH
MSLRPDAGARARESFGWWYAHRYLAVRRLAQAGFLGLFLSGPLLGVWITKGTLAQSLTLGVLPLSDPFILLQSAVAGHWPASTALIGGAIVLAGYLLVGGRAYGAWVCPVNPVTDAAGWLRRRLGLGKGWQPRRWTRRAFLAAVLAASAASGSLAWELVNPVTALHRALVFGAGFGLAASALIFLFDLFVARNGWCGHLCPVGAFYGLVGEAAALRVSAAARSACDDCMDCYAVCPEPQVITPALKGERTGHGPLILAGDCLNCGRCIDVCSESVFRFTHRFDQSLDDGRAPSRAALQGQGG